MNDESQPEGESGALGEEEEYSVSEWRMTDSKWKGR